MSSNAIKRKTPTFGLNIINYDFPRWHTFDWQNWDTLDAVLKAAGLTAVKGIWQNNTSYLVGDRVVDDASSTIWICSVAHTSAASGNFSDDRIAHPSYWKAISSVPVDRGNWVTAVVYNTWDIVKYNNAYYACTVQHTSTAFATDLSAGKWTLIFNLQPALDAETAAEASATAAANSASAANTSKNAAATSATNAATSATNAASSATAAGTSASNAAGSASSASTSASSAGTSATNASGSATSASNSASLAQSWAISLALVDGVNYGAKKYAIDAANSAGAAATFNPALYLAKTGGVMTGNTTFQDFQEGIVLAGGGKLVDQNIGGTSGNGRTLVFANNDSFEIVTEDGNFFVFAVRNADDAPYFKGNALWHNGYAPLAGMIAAFMTTSAPTGWLKANGAAVSLTTYPNLINIYCGDGNNASADHGYRCTNPASPTSTRSTTGGYIVLPDARGEFLRGLDDGRGVDTSRSMWLRQTQAIQNHTHTVSDPAHSHTVSDPGHTHPLAGGPNAPGTGTAAPAAQSGNVGYIGGMEAAPTGISIVSNSTGITITSSGGGAETRPRNIAPLFCIKY